MSCVDVNLGEPSIQVCVTPIMGGFLVWWLGGWLVLSIKANGFQGTCKVPWLSGVP